MGAEQQNRRTPAAVAVGVVTLTAVLAVTAALAGARLVPTAAPQEETRAIAVGESVEGVLSGRPARWVVAGTPGQTVVVELRRRGDGLDPFLHLADPAGMVLAEDDDGAGDLNSRIRHTFNEAGDHTIHVSGLGMSRGPYELSVRAVDG